MKSSIDLIEEDLWDHYSGLPNPAWYQYKNKLEDEEDSEDIDICDKHVSTEI